MKKRSFLYFFLFYLLPFVATGQENCSVRTSEKIELGLAFSVQYEIVHERGDSIQFKMNENDLQVHIDTTVEKPFDIELLQIQSTIKSGETFDTSIFSLTYIPWDTGFVHFIGFEYMLNQKAFPLPKVELEIRISLMDSSTVIKDIRERFPELPAEKSKEPTNSKTPWWVYLISSLLGLGILTSLLYWYFKKKGKTTSKIMSPFESAMDKLQHLEKSRIWEKDVKGFYSSLSWILRQYISEEVLINLLDKTTSQCGNLLRKKIGDAQLVRQILGHLSISDLVKFAGSKPDFATIERSIDEVKEIIQKVNALNQEDE